ncbi:MAG TPA: extracellular solute-binding protein [Candidatus Pelethocola excrementipullorum]|nr:extracellular solute-binding protein [Candidatus Pelethocola excrementipullorum]
MKKRIVSLVLASILTVGTLAGCSGGETKGGDSQKAQSTEAESKDEAKSESNESSKSESKGEETADATGEMVLYSSQSLDWSEALVKEFMETTGIHVEIISASTGDLVARLGAEKDNPQADILWGGVADSYHAIPELLEEYVSPEREFIYEKYWDPNNKWHACDISPNVIIYNTKLVSEEDAPKSWDDLLDPKFKGQIAFVDPAKSSAAFGALMGAVFAKGKDDGKGYEYMGKLIENMDGKFSSGSSAIIKQVADGEHAVGITYEEGALRYIESGADMQLVYPEEGTNISAGGISIIKNAPNMDSAKQFVDFMLGKEAQTYLTTTNRRSSRIDVPAPEGLTPVEDIPAVDYDMDWVKEHKDEFNNTWKDFVTQ